MENDVTLLLLSTNEDDINVNLFDSRLFIYSGDRTFPNKGTTIYYKI